MATSARKQSWRRCATWMRTRYHCRFNRDLGRMRSRDLGRSVERIIQGLKAASDITEVRNVVKLSGWERHYRVRIGSPPLGSCNGWRRGGSGQVLSPEGVLPRVSVTWCTVGSTRLGSRVRGNDGDDGAGMTGTRGKGLVAGRGLRLARALDSSATLGMAVKGARPRPWVPAFAGMTKEMGPE